MEVVGLWGRALKLYNLLPIYSLFPKCVCNVTSWHLALSTVLTLPVLGSNQFDVLYPTKTITKSKPPFH